MNRRYSLGKSCSDCSKSISNNAQRCKSCNNRILQSKRKWSDGQRKAFKETYRKKGVGKPGPSVISVHFWLKNHYGKASKCEFCGTKNTYRYEWALKHGCEYIKDVNSYYQLCVKCHRTYDGALHSKKENEM